MGDDDAGAFHLVQGLGDLPLGDVVQGGGGLVKDQDIRLRRDGPGDHQALALPAGDGAAAFLQHGVHAHGHLPDILGDAGNLRRLPGLLQLQGGGGDHNIIKDAAGEELSVLHHGADMPPHGVQIQMLQILPVVADDAPGGLFKAQQQAHQGGFSAAAAPDDGHVFPGTDLQAEVFEQRFAFRIIAESDVGHLNGTGETGDGFLIA